MTTNPYGNQDQRLSKKSNDQANALCAWLYSQRSRWIKADEIKDRFGFTKRKTRTLIEWLRVKENAPIASGQQGYKYTFKPEDIDNTIAPLLKSIQSKLKIVNSLKQSKENISGRKTNRTWDLFDLTVFTSE